MVINHFIACAWYAIGTLDWYALRWSDVFLSVDPSFTFAYATSLHWSLTQFTPASMEVYPKNEIERVFTIVSILFGLLMFTSFISSMTNTMTHLRQLNFEKRRQAELMKQYMFVNGVSLETGKRIQSFLRHQNTKERRRLHMTDIHAFRLLPQHLEERLSVEVYTPVVTRHSFFVRLRDNDELAFSGVCNLAMSEKSLNRGEELFRLGSGGSAMYFTVTGRMCYQFGFQEDEPIMVGKETWMCEAVLWTSWEHRGRLTGSAPVSEIMGVNAKEFHTIVGQSRVLQQAQKYARLFARRCLAQCRTAEAITDLWGTAEDVELIAERAFRNLPDFDDEEKNQTMSRVMLLWANGEAALMATCFVTWKQSVHLCRTTSLFRYKKRSLFFRLTRPFRRQWYCTRLCFR